MRKIFIKTNKPIRLAMFGLALLFLNLTGCKKDPKLADSIEQNTAPTKGIIGGNPILIDNVPYQAGIYVNGSFYGGGSILSDRWILTAAHVLTSGTNTQIAAGDVTIRVGSSAVYGGTAYNVDQIIRHGNYTGVLQINNDIALIHLSTPISFGPNVSVIPYAVPVEDPQITLNMPAQVSGWGAITYNSQTGNGTSPNQLFAADVKISNITSTFIYTSSTTSSQQSPCFGDSGGPLVVNVAGTGKVLVGVVNGWGDCNVGAKGYARVANYASWILQNTGVSRTFFSQLKYAAFEKTDCLSSIEDAYGLGFVYTVPFGQYTSNLSQADADAQAQTDVNANGQNFANANGICYLQMNTPRSASNLPYGGRGTRYIENVVWDASLSPTDTFVKIELLIRKDIPTSVYTYIPQYIVHQVISNSAANTGLLSAGLDSDLLTLPVAGSYRIRITGLSSNQVYMSNGFDLEKAED